MEIRADKQFVNSKIIRDSLKSLDLGDVNVKKFGKEGDFLIKIEEISNNKENSLAAIKQTLKENISSEINFRRIENVGPKVSGELLKSGIIAITLSLIAMLFYMD